MNDLERKLKVAESELHEVKISGRVASSRRAIATGKRAKSARVPEVWKDTDCDSGKGDGTGYNVKT